MKYHHLCDIKEIQSHSRPLMTAYAATLTTAPSIQQVTLVNVTLPSDSNDCQDLCFCSAVCLGDFLAAAWACNLYINGNKKTIKGINIIRIGIKLCHLSVNSELISVINIMHKNTDRQKIYIQKKNTLRRKTPRNP